MSNKKNCLKEERAQMIDKEKLLQEELEAARNQIEKLKAQEAHYQKLEVKIHAVSREKENAQNTVNELR